MGTPHVIIVYYKGQYRIAQYGQWDGSACGQGLRVLNFARDPELMAKLKAALDADILYEPTKEDEEAFKVKVDELARERRKEQRLLLARASSLSEGSEDLMRLKEEYWKFSRRQEPINVVCPSLSRDTGAEILNIVANASERVPLKVDLGAVSWAGWGWVLDLDLRVLECWETGVPDPRRRAGLGWELSSRFHNLDVGHGLHPTMMASFSHDALPDDGLFLKQCGET